MGLRCALDIDDELLAIRKLRVPPLGELSQNQSPQPCAQLSVRERITHLTWPNSKQFLDKSSASFAGVNEP